MRTIHLMFQMIDVADVYLGVCTAGLLNTSLAIQTVYG